MTILSNIGVPTLSYLFGSVNISILLFRLMGWKDPRTQFSGNPGVTNVYRQAGPVWAAVVLLADVGKAALIAFLAVRFMERGSVPLAALMLIAGNRFPCFHGFRGGKGVASYIGFTSVVAPSFTVTALCIWVLVYGLYKVPFIASMATLMGLSLGLAVYTDWHFRPLMLILIITVFLVLNHHQNFAGLCTKA